MPERRKYFVFNKITDFKRGWSSNLRIMPEGISIDDQSGRSAGVFFSPILDSREKETVWHRMVVQSMSLGDSSIRFTFYTSESRTTEVNGEVFDLEAIITDESIPLEEKDWLLAPYLVKTVLNPVDMLMHSASGRYLWFRIDLFSQGDESPQINRIKLYFPRESWLDYLPELYQQDPESKSFLERYLGIFQSLFMDMEDAIDNIAGYFDPDVTSRDFLEWLAGWVSIDDSYIWTEDRLRYLVKNAIRMYQMRGTRSAISEMVELYVGQKPLIVERYQVDKYVYEAGMAERMNRLYGDNSYVFTVVVNEADVPSTREYKALKKIIETCKPAHTEANLVVLKPYIFLDRYSYLGINSVLERYRPFNLDGHSAIQFSSVEG